MEEDTKIRESICNDCEYGIDIENCRNCLFNTLCNLTPLIDLPKHKWRW
jgi:hypothetical protein